MNEGYDFSGLLDAADDMMQGQMPDPFQDPPAAEPAWQGRAFGEEPVLQDAPPQSPPVDVAPMPMDQGMAFGSNPYSVPDLRNDPAGRLMENAIAQAGRDIGGSYFESGGTEMGGGRSQLDPSRVINYGMTDIDTSGNNPVLRVYNFGDRDGGAPTELVGKPIRDFNDYASIPSPFSPMRDPQTGDRLLDDQGRQRYNDLPGFDYRRVAGAGLSPTTLENGQQVYYDRNNNLTYGARDGQPGALLAGGLGLDGATRQQANYYGWVPTTDRNGRPVYYDEAGNRTFIRNRDGSAGRQILDVNRDARFLDGNRAGGAPMGGSPGRGQGGGGGQGVGGQGGGFTGDVNQWGYGQGVPVSSLGAYQDYRRVEQDGTPTGAAFTGINATGGLKAGDEIKLFGTPQNGQMVVTRDGVEYVYDRVTGGYLGELRYGNPAPGSNQPPSGVQISGAPQTPQGGSLQSPSGVRVTGQAGSLQSPGMAGIGEDGRFVPQEPQPSAAYQAGQYLDRLGIAFVDGHGYMIDAAGNVIGRAAQAHIDAAREAGRLIAPVVEQGKAGAQAGAAMAGGAASDFGRGLTGR